MTKSAWKKDPSIARPQRTLPAKNAAHEGTSQKADGRRNKGPKPKSKKPAKNGPTKNTKPIILRGKTRKPKNTANADGNGSAEYGVPLPRNRAEKVLR